MKTYLKSDVSKGMSLKYSPEGIVRKALQSESQRRAAQRAAANVCDKCYVEDHALPFVTGKFNTKNR